MTLLDSGSKNIFYLAIWHLGDASWLYQFGGQSHGSLSAEILYVELTIVLTIAIGQIYMYKSANILVKHQTNLYTGHMTWHWTNTVNQVHAVKTNDTSFAPKVGNTIKDSYTKQNKQQFSIFTTKLPYITFWFKRNFSINFCVFFAGMQEQLVMI